MNLKSLALAAGAAALTITPTAAFALSAGVLQQNGTNLRVLVSHRGAPVEARMVAVDEEFNELEGVKSFPEKVLVTTDPRRVVMSVPTNTWAICAVADVTYDDIPGQVGHSFIVESCARVNPHKLQNEPQLRLNGTRTPGGHGLRRSLQGTDVQIIQQGEEGRTSS